ncbi:MAG: endonuclease V [Planctomyces sp.]|nr:endonuclease V [Planctomyces sp.]
MSGASSSSRTVLPPLPDLNADLERRLAQTPPGQVTTFGALAKSLGDRRAAVWVANLVAALPENGLLPWHRVVRADGTLPAIGPRLERQRSRLAAEGVASVDVAPGRAIVDPRAPRRRDFEGASVLQPLLDWQREMAARIDESPRTGPIELVAGLDVAFAADGRACGAAVVVNVRERTVIGSAAASLPDPFPYIPGYLTFRELPVLLELWQRLAAAGLPADIAMVDGQGRLHPRRAGIASAFAAVSAVPTIGVGKSLLCGRPLATNDPDLAEIVDDGERIGWSLSPGGRFKPIYISVGGGLSLDQALACVRSQLTGRRLPLPTHEADRLSKQAVGGPVGTSAS